MDINDIINKICKHLPKGYELSLIMKNGSTQIEMYNGWTKIELGDSADKSLVEQLGDALCIANGFIEKNDK